MRWIAIAAIVACAPPRPASDTGSDGSVCVDGALRCTGLVAQTCAGGTFVDTLACPTGCTDGHCTACSGGTGTCDGDTAHACADDGSGYVDTACDPLLGMTCGNGKCAGACSPDQLGTSYIGCEYYPIVTANMVDESFDFAVAVANSSTTGATVTFDGGPSRCRSP